MAGGSCYRVSKETQMTREAAERSCGQDAWLAGFPGEEEWDGVAGILGEGQWWTGGMHQGTGNNRKLVYENGRGQVEGKDNYYR